MKNKVNVMKRIIIQAQRHYILVYVLKKKHGIDYIDEDKTLMDFKLFIYQLGFVTLIRCVTCKTQILLHCTRLSFICIKYEIIIFCILVLFICILDLSIYILI